ncbi:MAG TPA: hypothetical protein DCZ43_10850 [candidate division Zixibacteria bacterium]|nr:hypothetical protein [candidate division Zixibacteria bacterium]
MIKVIIRQNTIKLTSFILCLCWLTVNANAGDSYLWLANSDSSPSITERVTAPIGFERRPIPAGSFEDWLRHLPTKKGSPPVHLFDGTLKANQNAHFAVIDIDTGDKDLQQCADAVIRLRAEYLYSLSRYNDIHFDFTSGDKASFRKWINGYRPVVTLNLVSWFRSSKVDSSYASFRSYLEIVFRYAGTYSLKKELQSVNNPLDMKIGDIFIQGKTSAHPGHAVIVVDMAFDTIINQKIFLLAQSYMPAQEIHILKNPTDKNLSPWYKIEPGKSVLTPEWTFEIGDLMRFK